MVRVRGGTTVMSASTSTPIKCRTFWHGTATLPVTRSAVIGTFGTDSVLV